MPKATQKYTMKLIQDENAESPNDNSDDHETGRVFLVTTTNRYFQVEHPLIPRERGARSYDIPAEVKESHFIYPLRAYIHGGVALSLGTNGPFSDPWDSGQIGHVFVTKKAGEVGPDPEMVAECLVEEWNQYLTGDVWGYVIEDENGETVDSCWGMYGRDYARSEGNDALARYVEFAKLKELKTVMAVCR